MEPEDHVPERRTDKSSRRGTTEANGSHDSPASFERQLDALGRLQEIITTLRGPDGCPWDQRQTLQSLAPNLLEEACETIDAVESVAGPATRSAEICEELGDLLMNIFLGARIAEEDGGFDLAAVASGVSEKLVRRHPHVFGTETIDSVEGVLERWTAIKAAERGGGSRPSLLAGVPRSLPPLSGAYELGRRAAKVGFDWASPRAVLEKVREELAEVEACLCSGTESPRERLAEEIGDLLFAVANLARKADIAPQEALRGANRKFRRRFQYMEEHSTRALEALSLEELEELWQRAKEAE
jgi:MazG family protein